ncbi:MAG: sigma-70 family RNA polymerase sigma factor [Gemmataceae bacterium]|nr:sigma-70 family RNA polymerase sigma factor [Gemmataceae bacterium]MDW8244643.1 sigma-70 family RNA polymerase sigma factor [Thermogemmata sp.]
MSAVPSPIPSESSAVPASSAPASRKESVVASADVSASETDERPVVDHSAKAVSRGALVRVREQPSTALVRTAAPAPTALAPVTERPLTPELVFREYAPRIYALARRMLGNDADAEDVTQDVLLQVVRKLHTFRGESQLGTWLHRVTVNAALAHRSRRASRQKHETSEVEETALDAAVLTSPVKRWHATPEEPVLTAEQAAIIENAIAQLPEPYRDVYVLADVEQLPNAEIAERLGLSVAAVKSRLHRARLKMREALARYFQQEDSVSASGTPPAVFDGGPPS